MDYMVNSLILECPLFRNARRDELTPILNQMQLQPRSFEKGRLVALRGDRVEGLKLLLRGSLSAEIPSPSGKVLKVETLTAPCTVAGPLAFAAENYLPVQLTGLEDGLLLSIPEKQSLVLLSSQPEILKAYLGDCGNKINFLSEKIRLFQFHSLSQKIAHYLLGLVEKQKSSQIRLPMTMETLSDLFGVARPSLSRSLGNLVDQGTLERRGKEFFIPDLEGLREMLED